jgi:hypothetical protein
MSAGQGGPNPKVSNDLHQLAPLFRQAVEAALAECNGPPNNFDAIVYEAYRSPELQAVYYARGRTVVPPTHTVTNARTNLQSWHGYGLAVDVVHRVKYWEPPGGEAWFRKVAEVFKKHGCAWGGDWRNPDTPHMQWGRCKPSPSERARELYRAGGARAVWEAVGALAPGAPATSAPPAAPAPPPQPAAPAPPALSNPLAPTQPLAWGKRVSPAFRAKVVEICADLKMQPSDLMACMAFESGETFSPSVPNAAHSGAVGLIQFMPSTAAGLHTTTAALAAMTAEEQLDYVKAYFMPHKGKLKNIGDVYMAILWPAAVGKSDSEVLFHKDDVAHPARYRLNAGLDANKDGNVTRGETCARIVAKLAKGMLPDNAWG